jgi:hypothetical protein
MNMNFLLLLLHGPFLGNAVTRAFPLKKHGDGGSSSSSSDSGRSLPVDTEAVRARNSQAAALHVRRSLEARRKRDQEMGIRAPKVQSASVKMTSLRDKRAASEFASRKIQA